MRDNRAAFGLLLLIVGWVLVAYYARPAVALGVALMIWSHNLEHHKDKEKP